MSELKLPELFGSRVFNEETMKERLSGACYQAWKRCVTDGASLELAAANEIAGAMKTWAVERGCTHYTHWFQPMTGFTAEKHDSFIAPSDHGRVILEFSGKNLVRGEADASSFPSGGLRATFEARGYTAWDPTSYAFVKDDTLCIPTAFCSYTGEALDKKTPLLRSMQAISDQACKVLHLFGKDVDRVATTVGPEQEYFLIKKEDYQKRLDLVLCGRTLFGSAPSKGQELEEHYFGTIRPIVSGFMKELDEELWKLGIPAKTKHNEVAPCQHELAPIYDTTNVAIDHNLLTMEMMKKLAPKYGLVCLQHEKPFEGVNGSGKHNNWSMSTTHENLLDPGDTPMENLQFLVFLAAVIKAVDEYADLLRTSVATPGNDHRLGANEAPPAIISIFVGEELEAVIDAIASDSPYAGPVKMKMDLGVDVLPKFSKDTTDRNRTSPFAFTGNKFEFRMVGSSDSIADANTTLNAIVAEAMCEAADVLEKADDFNTACFKLIHDMLSAHHRVIFNGNGYSDAWVEEAARRGLPNLPSMVNAIPSLTTEKAENLFTKFNIYTKSELEARAEIMYETYAKVLKIETQTMIHMAGKHYIPAAIHYCTRLGQSIAAITGAGVAAPVQKELLEKCSALLSQASEALEKLKVLLPQVDSMDDVPAMAMAYHDQIVPAMAALRKPVDELELLVDKAIWPMPTYGDLMFEV